MVALEQKFDDLLTFVHLMVRRDTENENRKKDGNKNTNDEILGYPYSKIGPPPRPPTPLKPEERDSSWIARFTVWKRKSDSCKA